ncbi:MAG: pyruvate kinase [Sedimentisphaerales bacterium]|nr:pyruvate kinase [Sedimentisphaerales bacterium]MBN2842056.1 pyruvate kinase [Sedimentisphaerales bacterium]
MSKAKIICTVGPASNTTEILERMIKAGMSVARLNFSHGTHETHQQNIDTIRQIHKNGGARIPILQDLAGFRIRVGRFENDYGAIKLRQGMVMSLINAESSGRPDVIPFDYQGSFACIKPGINIFIDDGNIALKVISSEEAEITAEVIVGGILKNNKGINIPEAELEFESLTDGDKEDILFGIKNKVSMIAQSFVRTAQDMINVREFINKHKYNCPLIAKIECREGINNIDEILDVSDGVMIARGDMGVSLPMYEVPMIQKKIIKNCIQRDEFVITATQMLESMTENVRPTRAEVSDVANAILDGSDYVMLSGETASGKHPVEAVEMMKNIIRFTEKSMEGGFPQKVCCRMID